MFSKIPKEKKDEILAKIKGGEKVPSLATQYGISDKTIYYWLRTDTGEEVVSLIRYNKLKRENEELKRIVGELTLNLSQEKKSEIVSHSTIKTVVAKAVGISRKNIYRHPKRPSKDLALAVEINEAHKTHPAYGQYKMALHLGVNHKRAERVMKRFGIKAPRVKTKKYFCTVSVFNHNYTNLIASIPPVQFTPHLI